METKRHWPRMYSTCARKILGCQLVRLKWNLLRFFRLHCTGEVIKILLIGKWVFRFKDNEHRKHSRDQLEKFSKTVSNRIVAFDDDTNGDACEKEKDIEMVSMNDSDDESNNQLLLLIKRSINCCLVSRLTID